MTYVMTYEKQFCTRCTNLHNCVLVGTSWYCQWCFDTVVNDPETKTNIEKIIILSKLEDIENG